MKFLHFEVIVLVSLVLTIFIQVTWWVSPWWVPFFRFFFLINTVYLLVVSFIPRYWRDVRWWTVSFWLVTWLFNLWMAMTLTCSLLAGGGMSPDDKFVVYVILSFTTILTIAWHLVLKGQDVPKSIRTH